jgi:hypothetical protein
MLRWSGMRSEGGVQLGSEGADVRQGVACGCVLVCCDYSEEAKELLESVAAEEGSDE